MAKRNGLQTINILWPFAPDQVKLNRDTNLLKIIAIISMVIDHSGKMLFDNSAIMRIIGRLAFPIFAYCLTVGSVYTRNPLKYISRVVLLALVSQPLYAIALGHKSYAMFNTYSFADEPIRYIANFYLKSWTAPNIMVVLALGLVLIWALRNRQMVIFAGVLLLVYLLDSKGMLSSSYGIKGIFLMLLFYMFASRPLISFPIVLAYMVWWGLQGASYTLFGVSFSIQMFAVFALPMIYIPTNSGIKLNKWVFYWFYPAHLLAIMLLDKLVF